MFKVRIFSVISAVLFALLVLSGPAAAHHKDGHENGGGKSENAQAKDNDGDADSDSGTTYTEDDDTNDGGTPNNVPDDGDNAHPSGKDRSVENGNSSTNPNQGKAESDPDDDTRGPERTNGGPDKPNGTGGVDKADQDGNNGCGNDDDFEDDSEGWCGKKPTDDGPAPLGPEAPQPPSGGIIIDTPETPQVDDDTADPGDTVGGVLIDADQGQPGDVVAARGAVLPFTGGSVFGFLLTALGLMSAGVVTMRVHRKRS